MFSVELEAHLPVWSLSFQTKVSASGVTLDLDDPTHVHTYTCTNVRRASFPYNGVVGFIFVFHDKLE